MDLLSAYLDTLSETQAQVLDCIENNKHVIVNANPGAGKTHLILQIASAFPQKNLLVVSFNTGLVNDTSAKLSQIQEYRSGWTAAHTYHGLMGTLVNEVVYDDMMFGQCLTTMNLEENAKHWKYRDLELLVIDEAQDLKQRLVLLILVILSSIATNRTTLQIIFALDEKQTLYSFYPINKADARFATLAKAIYGPFVSGAEFTNVVLPVSYRLTPQSASLINVLMPNSSSCNIVSGHQYEEPHNYVTLFVLDIYRDAAATVLDIVRRESGTRHNYGDILVLVNSLRSKKSPARAIVDMLVASDIPVHVLRSTKVNSEDMLCDVISNDVRKGKVNFLTDCGAKGLQFRTVIKISNTALLHPESVSNSQFVALTRHSKRLYILQNVRNTTQSQLDDLLSHPNITQRVLRVIIKRQVPTDLPKKQHRRESVVSPSHIHKDGNGVVNSSNNLLVASLSSSPPPPLLPSVVDCSTMFAFLDIEHMEHLMDQVSIERLGAEEFDDSIIESSNLGFVDPSAVSKYLTENVIPQQHNGTFIDVTRVINRSLMLAIEFYFTKCIPIGIRNIFKRTQFSENPYERCMYDRIQDPMFEITSLHHEDKNIFFQRILDHMSIFGHFAIVCDAQENYRDLLFQLTNVSFVMTDSVQYRMHKLRIIFESLIVQHEQVTEHKIQALRWDNLVTGHFISDECHPFDLVTHIPLSSDDCSFHVVISNESAISNDDRLCALAGMLCNRTKLQPLVTHLFVVNLAALSVEKIDLLSSCEQPLSQHLIVTDAKSKHVDRYILCPFLADALRYKFWNDSDEKQEDRDQEDTSENSLYKRSRLKENDAEDDDDLFVADIHKQLEQIRKKTKVETFEEREEEKEKKKNSNDK